MLSNEEKILNLRRLLWILDTSAYKKEVQDRIKDAPNKEEIIAQMITELGGVPNGS